MIEYLGSGCIPAAMRTALDIHCDANYPGRDVSRKMGIAFPKGCCICPLGRSKRSPHGKLPVPKSTAPAGRIACDVKEVHEAPHDGNTCCFGFIDSFTNRSWLKPMAGRAAADLVMCCDELVSQDLFMAATSSAWSSSRIMARRWYRRSSKRTADVLLTSSSVHQYRAVGRVDGHIDHVVQLLFCFPKQALCNPLAILFDVP